MKFKTKTLFLTAMLFAVPALALHFSYDNYSGIPLLKYSFTFDGNNWFKSDDANLLAPKGFKTVEFGDSIPVSWEISPPAGKTLSCWQQGDHEKKSVKSIVTLTSHKSTKEDNLLLDVIDSTASGFIVGIIDLDGEQRFSNVIECTIS